MRNFKRALALVLAAILVVGTFATVSAARASEEKWYQVGIDYLQEIGVDYISPSQAEMEITREDFVLWIAKIESHQLLDEAWNAEICFGDDMAFTDVQPGVNQFAAIAYAHQSGFITGEDDDGDGVYTFAPDRNIILGEVAAIIVRLMGYEDRVSFEGEENWAYNYMRAAQNYCNAFNATFLEETRHYDPYVELTYGEAAYIVATIMNQTGNVNTSRTADGIKLNSYFDAVTATLVEDRYFVVSLGEEVVLACVGCDEIITVSAKEFEELVCDALEMKVNVADVLPVGSLINVINNKKTGKIEGITFESTEGFTTILNTYLLNKTAEGLRLGDDVPDFAWTNVVKEDGEVKSAQLIFNNVPYTITNDDSSEIYFYSENMKGERLSVAEAMAKLVTAAEGCVYAVFSAAAENVTYKEEINAYDQSVTVIDTVKYDTVVIKESANFVADFHNDGDEFSFVVKTPAGEIVNTFAPSPVQIGIIEKVTVYAEEGYFLTNIKLGDGTLLTDIKIPATKADRVIEYTYEANGATATYSYNIANNFPMLDEADEAIKAGVTSGLNAADATAIWLNDRCVKFAVGEGNEAVYLATAYEAVVGTGFVTSSTPVEGLPNTYEVAITLVNANGVCGIYKEDDKETVTVRARASSMFDLANYKVYARIWNDSLLNPAAGAEDTRVEGETDLIYVDICKDAMSKYLLCSTGASLNDDWSDIYGGHKLGEIVYNTEFVDEDGDGLEEKKVTSVASIIGYEPYYARTLVEGVYTYVVKYTRIVFVSDYQIVDFGLQIALELMRFQFTFGGQIENGGDLVLGDEGFLMYDDIKDEDKVNYTQEKGWYVFDKEVSFKKGNNTIVVPEGAVLKLEDNAEVVYKTLENGEYDYQYTDIVTFEDIEVTIWNVAFDAESIAAALVENDIADVTADDLVLEDVVPTIVFGENGIYIDVEAEDDVIAYRVADDAKVVFVVPSADGFDCTIYNYSELVNMGVFGVEWNAEVDDNKITAIAIITMDEAAEAEIPEGVEIPEKTPETPVDPPVDPEPPVDPVDPPVGPTYTFITVDDIDVDSGKVVYLNNSANFTAETIHNDGVDGDFMLVIKIEGAVSIDNEVQPGIRYDLDMNSGAADFDSVDISIENVLGMVKGSFAVIDADGKVDNNDGIVVVNGKLNTKTAEVSVIDGKTVIATETANVYVEVGTVTFITVNAKGNLEVSTGTIEGMTAIEYIAINGTMYVIK